MEFGVCASCYLFDSLKEKKKDIKLGQYKGGKDLGGIEGGENYDQNILYGKIIFQL